MNNNSKSKINIKIKYNPYTKRLLFYEYNKYNVFTVLRVYINLEKLYYRSGALETANELSNIIKNFVI